MENNSVVNDASSEATQIEATETEATETEATEAVATEAAVTHDVPEQNAAESAEAAPDEAPPAVAKPKPQSAQYSGKIYQNLKVPLTDVQVLGHGRKQAQLLQELAGVEEDEKQVKAQYKAKKEKLLADIKFESQIVNNGYIFKDVECEVRFNEPVSGQKSIVRLDTGDVVAIETMTPREMNRPLFDQREIAGAESAQEADNEADDEQATEQATGQSDDEINEVDGEDGEEEEDSTADIFPVNGASNETASIATNGANGGYQFEEDPPPVPPMPKMPQEPEASDTTENPASITSPKRRGRSKATEGKTQSEADSET